VQDIMKMRKFTWKRCISKFLDATCDL